MSKIPVHVAVAVIEKDGEFLIAKRPIDKELGGLWEFPGGKVEIGESVFTALTRELREELDIKVTESNAFLKIFHDYPDKRVLLDIHKVIAFSGEEKGNEGQQLKWVKREELCNFDFPPANKKILKALKAPEIISITPDGLSPDSDFELLLQSAISINSQAVLFRADALNDSDYLASLAKLNKALALKGMQDMIRVLVNRSIDAKSGYSGLHFSSTRLFEAVNRNPNPKLEGEGVAIENVELVSASCHNIEEIKAAEKLGCDFIFLSPVLQTDSHPDANPMGWEKAASLLSETELPVILLGGLEPKDLEQAKDIGALGVAGISKFFPDKKVRP